MGSIVRSRADAKAYRLIRRIRDFDFAESIKSKLKQGAKAISGALEWTSEKMREKIDPEKFNSEKEAKKAEVEKLKELSTIRGLLKEMFRVIGRKISNNEMLRAVGNKLVDKANQIIGYIIDNPIKSYFAYRSIRAILSLLRFVISIGMYFLDASRKKEVKA